LVQVDVSGQLPAAIVTFEEFETLVRPLIGLAITRAREGLGGDLLVNFGECAGAEARGEFLLHVEMCWSIELSGRVLTGASDHDPFADRELQALIGDTVVRVELDAPVRDIVIRLASGRVLKSFLVHRTRAQWHLRLPDRRFLTAWRGLPHTSGSTYAPDEDDDVTGEAWSTAIAERFGRPRAEPAANDCATCAAFVRINAPARLLEYGVCSREGSPLERRAVHRTSGCAAHVARTSGPVPGPPNPPEFVVSLAEARALLAPLVGQSVTRPWKGYGSAIFFELGELSTEREGKTGYNKGAFTLMIEWDWRIEVAWRVALSSSHHEDVIESSVEHLFGTTVTNIDVCGEVPQLVVQFSNGMLLRTRTLRRGDPEWTVFLRDSRWVTARHGELLCYAKRYLDDDEDDPGARAREKEASARWISPPKPDSPSSCNNCEFRERLASHGPLLSYGCCTNPASPFDARVVHANDVCAAFAPEE
jgi:hypothetical protein